MHDESRKAALREFLFRTSVLLKGLDALLEIVGGIALWLISPSFIVRVTAILAQDEIAEDPRFGSIFTIRPKPLELGC